MRALPVSALIISICTCCTGQLGMPISPALWRHSKVYARQERFAPGGVSNFNVSDMEELFRVPHGDRCGTNQVLYNLTDRGIEQDLLPWCERHSMPVMAYSPLGGAGANLLRDPTLARIGAAHGCSASAVALAWTIRNGNAIAIPESGSAEHVKENAVALSLILTPDELRTLDSVHPPPNRQNEVYYWVLFGMP